LDQFDPEATDGLIDAFIESIGTPNLELEKQHEIQLLEDYSKRKIKAPVSIGIQINS